MKSNLHKLFAVTAAYEFLRNGWVPPAQLDFAKTRLCETAQRSWLPGLDSN